MRSRMISLRSSQTFTPRPRISARTLSMPFQLIVLIARVLTRRRTQRFSLGTQKRFHCRVGSWRRFVLTFEWETLFAVRGRFPVSMQTLATVDVLPFAPALAPEPDG